jgi:hypothetical protein
MYKYPIFFRHRQSPKDYSEILALKLSQPKEYAIPKGSTLLVTAANDYIATHIVDLFLELGYRVRGTLLSEKSWLNTFFEGKYGKDKFETVIVADLSADNALTVVQVVNRDLRLSCLLTNDRS